MGGRVDWVRFAETGGGRTLGIRELGSFGIFAGWNWVCFAFFG